MTFEIEKDIPLSEPKGGPFEGTGKYPWREMTVGDSFYTPCTGGLSFREHHKLVASCAAQASKRLGSKFVTRRDREGVRVWRTE